MRKRTERALVELERLFVEATALYTAGESQSSLGVWQQANALSREMATTPSKLGPGTTLACYCTPRR